jgi:hypothetical protein
LKEHHWHIQLEHLDKLVMAEHSNNLGHCILVHNASILSTLPRCLDHIIRVETETEFHPII